MFILTNGARKRRSKFKVGRVRVLNNLAYRRAEYTEEEEQIQRRQSACPQYLPCLGPERRRLGMELLFPGRGARAQVQIEINV